MVRKPFRYIDNRGDVGVLSPEQVDAVIQAMHQIGCDGVIRLMHEELRTVMPAGYAPVVDELHTAIVRLRLIPPAPPELG